MLVILFKLQFSYCNGLFSWNPHFHILQPLGSAVHRLGNTALGFAYPSFIYVNFLLAVIAKIKSRTTKNLSSEKLRVLQSLGDIREI